MKPSTQRAQSAPTLVCLFFLFSWIGWSAETVYFGMRWHVLADRGLLALPLCPIYGACLLGMYLWQGTLPRDRLLLTGRTMQSRRTDAYRRSALSYFAAAVFLPTVAEFCVAALSQGVLGLTLWDYSYRPLNLFGYICLDRALLWGILLTLAMHFLWPPCFAAVSVLPLRARKAAACTAATLTACDFALQILCLALTGRRFSFFRL